MVEDITHQILGISKTNNFMISMAKELTLEIPE